MDLITLFRQFCKGTAYFNQRYAEGQGNPAVVRQTAPQIRQFEKEVLAPFDEACRKASPEDLQLMWDQI